MNGIFTKKSKLERLGGAIGDVLEAIIDSAIESQKREEERLRTFAVETPAGRDVLKGELFKLRIELASLESKRYYFGSNEYKHHQERIDELRSKIRLYEREILRF